MRRIHIILFFVAINLTIIAQSNYNSIVIKRTDNQVDHIAMYDVNKTTLEGEYLRFETTGMDIVYPMNLIRSFTVENHLVTGNNEMCLEMFEIILDGRLLTLKGVPAGEIIIYNTIGVEVARAITNNDTVTIDCSLFPAGLYIIHGVKTAAKIILK